MQQPALPAGGHVDLSPAGDDERRMVSAPFDRTLPAIRELINNSFAVYVERDEDRLHAALQQMAFNATLDGPLYFFRGTERAKMFNRLLTYAFERVVFTPKLVRVTMLSEEIGLVEVDATLVFYPRQLLPRVWPVTALVPDHVPVQGTWSLVAKGDDDKVISVTERAHNMPVVPQLLRALPSTALTTGLLTLVTLWQ